MMVIRMISDILCRTALSFSGLYIQPAWPDGDFHVSALVLWFAGRSCKESQIHLEKKVVMICRARVCSFWGCNFGGVYISCIYSHARWSFHRRLRSLLLCPFSVVRLFPFVWIFMLPQLAFTRTEVRKNWKPSGIRRRNWGRREAPTHSKQQQKNWRTKYVSSCFLNSSFEMFSLKGRGRLIHRMQSSESGQKV